MVLTEKNNFTANANASEPDLLLDRWVGLTIRKFNYIAPGNSKPLQVLMKVFLEDEGPLWGGDEHTPPSQQVTEGLPQNG